MITIRSMLSRCLVDEFESSLVYSFDQAHLASSFRFLTQATER